MFPWSAATASHAVLLCRMVQDEIGGWHQVPRHIFTVLINPSVLLLGLMRARTMFKNEKAWA